ncbi:MAG TPA: 4-hydroxy-tetrahydrodipicolinate synthase [Bacteroidales bacterium]|nr:4-hydroxy-tetrahydrodipicolinate synthase [Bacteroidales bacterium]HPT02590.1 4-hydroxy-tetrahydrodipicolinate synthase [Bacteroidales bacterium]
MNSKFKGTGVALVTPFHKQGTIDFSSLGKLIEHTIEGGVNYLVVQGTTAETATLTKEEKHAVSQFVIDTVDKRVPLMLGVGCNNTQEVVNTLRTASYEGFDAVLSVTPYYNKPQQRGLYLHYKNIAAVSPLPIIMYNVPGRTSVNMKAETTLELAHEFDNIIGVKEASGNIEQVMDIIRQKPKDFLVISGDDLLTAPMLTMGADGLISVAANAFPKEISDLVMYGMKGDLKKMREIHYRMTDFIKAIFADGNPSGIKAALEIKGLISNNLRLPLVKIEKNLYNTLATLIQEIEPGNLS